MIRSMTGYGRAEKNFKKKTITVEVRALNSKMFDLNMRTPWVYKEKELELRNMLNESLFRGKIDLYINIDLPEDTQTHTVNHALAKSFAVELKKLGKDLGIGSEDLLGHVLRLPNVVAPPKDALDEAEWKQMRTLTSQAIKTVDAYRVKEGAVLKNDFTKRIKLILKDLASLDKFEKERIAQVRKRLDTSLLKNIDSKLIDRDRFEQELIFYLEKFDINEEKVRLKSNCEHFLKETESKETNLGKKLGFISQEVGREINTIGAKANHAGMQKVVVQMKDELEKIKEQLNNVL